MAKKVCAIENGQIYVFNDEFPDKYEQDAGENATHGLFYTNKTYSKYVLRFEYKWGVKTANNFSEWQYDAGVYYHALDDQWNVCKITVMESEYSIYKLNGEVVNMAFGLKPIAGVFSF